MSYEQTFNLDFIRYLFNDNNQLANLGKSWLFIHYWHQALALLTISPVEPTNKLWLMYLSHNKIISREINTEDWK